MKTLVILLVSISVRAQITGYEYVSSKSDIVIVDELLARGYKLQPSKAPTLLESQIAWRDSRTTASYVYLYPCETLTWKKYGDEVVAIDCNGKIVYDNVKGILPQYNFKGFLAKQEKRKAEELALPKVERSEETEESLRQYYDSSKLSPLEGIYTANHFRIGIKKIGYRFIGIVLETDSEYWTKGEIKLYLDDANMGVYPCTILDAKKRRSDSYAEFDEKIFKVGDFDMIKIYPPSK